VQGGLTVLIHPVHNGLPALGFHWSSWQVDLWWSSVDDSRTGGGPLRDAGTCGHPRAAAVGQLAQGAQDGRAQLPGNERRGGQIGFPEWGLC
jgi:hypothetical protein